MISQILYGQFDQSMTCYLFWVAAPATPQTEIPPHPQPRATCISDGRNSQAQAQPQLYLIHILPHIKACNFSFSFYSIIYWMSQKWIFWVKNCFNCQNPQFLSYRIVIYIKRKGILILNLALLLKNVRSCNRTSQAYKFTARTHIASFNQNGFAHRNLLPHIATRNLRSHIASHALQYSGLVIFASSLLLYRNICTYVHTNMACMQWQDSIRKRVSSLLC